MYRKEHWAGAAVTFIFALVCYLGTMAPSLTFWDAGEFLASAYTLGIPHAPGTPLFVILGRVISSLPLPLSIPWRLNFLSVLFGAAAAAFLYLIAVKVLSTWQEELESFGSRVAVHAGAFAAAVIPAFLQTVWSNTTEYEVYAVGTATFILVAWLMHYMGSVEDHRRVQRTVLLVIYLVSLSIANHLLVVLVSPAVIVYTLLHDRRHLAYWLSVIGLFLAAYLILLKGVDLAAVAERLTEAGAGSRGFASLARQLSATLGILFGIGGYLESSPAMLIGLAIAAGCGWWAWRERALSFFGLAAGLFLLGFSIHAYLLIRAGFNPPVNEGNPDSLRALWAVIGREQYGSAYGFLPRQVWTLLTGKKEILTSADLFENIRYFFKYNLPFYNQYFGWQFGGRWPTFVFVLVGLAGAWRHLQSDRRSFYFWLTVFLFTGPILNAYMNFRIGHTQFPDLELHPGAPEGEFLREVRERDYFFIVSFAFYGFWSGLGLAWAIEGVRRLLLAAGRFMAVRRAAFGVAAAAILAVAFVPLRFNWGEVDRSDNFIPANYARDLMNSMAPDAILFTNGDNDTFPLWYVREVEGVRKDCRVVNLSLINLDWYIRQMRDEEPRVPISFTDAQLDSLRPFVSTQDAAFRMAGMELLFSKGTFFYIKDLLVLDILRTNNWKRPIYYTTSVALGNRTELTPYFVQEGITFRVYPRKATEIAAENPNIKTVQASGGQIGVDLEKTRRLLYEEYDYDTFFKEGAAGEKENQDMKIYFGNATVMLGFAYMQEGNIEEAIKALQFSRQFFTDPLSYSDIIAQLYARLGRYDEAANLICSLAGTRPASELVQELNKLAQAAADNQSAEPSARLLRMGIEMAPEERNTWANLFMLYNAAGQKEQAVAIIEEYLGHFPADTTVADELARYRESGQFNLTRAFGIHK